VPVRLQAVLLNCGVEKAEQQQRLLALLADCGAQKMSKQRRDARLRDELRFGDKALGLLLELLDVEDSCSRVASKLRLITRREQQAVAALAKEGNRTLVGLLTRRLHATAGLHELESVVSFCEAFQVKMPVLVCPKLVFSLHQYDGAVFQVVCEQRGRQDVSGRGWSGGAWVSLSPHSGPTCSRRAGATTGCSSGCASRRRRCRRARLRAAWRPWAPAWPSTPSWASWPPPPATATRSSARWAGAPCCATSCASSRRSGRSRCAPTTSRSPWPTWRTCRLGQPVLKSF